MITKVWLCFYQFFTRNCFIGISSHSIFLYIFSKAAKSNHLSKSLEAKTVSRYNNIYITEGSKRKNDAYLKFWTQSGSDPYDFLFGPEHQPLQFLLEVFSISIKTWRNSPKNLTRLSNWGICSSNRFQQMGNGRRGDPLIPQHSDHTWHKCNLEWSSSSVGAVVCSVIIQK